MLLEISFQVRLMISDLVSIAASYQENYKPKYLNVLQTAINSFVSTRKFTTDDYFRYCLFFAESLTRKLDSI